MTPAPNARVIEEIVGAACRAPSVHNTQPWKWTYDGQSLDLYADWSRQVSLGDPDRRDLVISCGAALHHAVTAAAGLGYRADVRRVSDPDDHRHLAATTLRPHDAGPHDVELAGAIDQRRTDRRTPSSVPVPQNQLADLVRIGAERGAFVIPLRDQDHASLVGDLRQLAALAQQDDDLYLAELARWTHSSGADGVPDEAVLAQTGQASRFSASSRFPPGVLDDEPPAAGAAPSWLVVAASSDDTLSRLRVGEALSAMLLHATLLDLAVVPYTQAVAVDATRRRLEEGLLGGGRSLQLILRAGVMSRGREQIPRTRRRPVQDVLTTTRP